MGIFNNLFDIDSRDNYAVTGLNKELNSLYIYNYFIKNKKNNLVITNSLYEANDVYNRLLNYTNKVLFFPMDDFITSEVTDISPEFVIDRLTTLNKLLGSGKYIVVTNLMGILRYLPNTKLYKNKIIDINKDLGVPYRKDIETEINIIEKKYNESLNGIYIFKYIENKDKKI